MNRIIIPAVFMATLLAGCGAHPVSQPASHTRQSHHKSQTPTTPTTTAPSTALPTSASASNPALQTGSVSDATAWIQQHGRSVAKIIAINNGAIILTEQPGWAIYVDTTHDVWEPIPLPLANLTFERQTADGGLLFLVQGPIGDTANDTPFPYQVLCKPQGSADQFVTTQGPIYYPIAQGVSFGGKPNEVLTFVGAIDGGLQFDFGPTNADDAAFYADFTTVPVTSVSYDSSQRALVLTFAKTHLGDIKNLTGIHGEITSATFTQDATAVKAVLSLAPGASYYSGKTWTMQNQRQTPILDVSAFSAPVSPWEP